MTHYTSVFVPQVFILVRRWFDSCFRSIRISLFYFSGLLYFFFFSSTMLRLAGVTFASEGFFAEDGQGLLDKITCCPGLDRLLKVDQDCTDYL